MDHPALLALPLLAIATAAHLAFWSWYLRVPDGAGELLHAATADGWTLALARRRPRGPARPLPVLLVHGLAVNRAFLDFGLPPHSLSAHLAAAGLDSFALDLRGHGGSRRGPGGDWCFDDYLRHDLPAALAAVRAATGAPRVLLVGHSQGALLALALAAARPEEVAAVVAVAGPVRLADGPRVRAVSRAAFALRSLARLLARLVAPFAGLLRPPLVQASMDTRNVDRPVLRRLLANAIEDVPRGVAAQFLAWMEEGSWRSADGAVDYRAGLSRAAQPALFVAGPADGLAPPAAVRAGHDAWGGPREWLLAGRAAGLSADYGHGDLVFGRRAPEETFPPIRDFLLRHAGEAGRGGGA